MKSAPRSCPVPGCGRPHHGEQVLCKAHWLAVPKPLRDEVWRCYRAWLADISGTIDATRHLRAAQQQAIAAVS